MVKEDVINLLLDQKEQPFNIYVTKSTLLYHSTYEDIANDYAMLAYAGQILNDASDNFEYNYVSVAEHSSVLFEVTAKDLEKLASVILELSYGYNNEPQDGEEIFYLDDVYQFIDDVKEGKIDAVCIDFIEDHEQYLKEADEQEKEDED